MPYGLYLAGNQQAFLIWRHAATLTNRDSCNIALKQISNLIRVRFKDELGCNMRDIFYPCNCQDALV
jgi:hypothetical protein